MIDASVLLSLNIDDVDEFRREIFSSAIGPCPGYKIAGNRELLFSDLLLITCSVVKRKRDPLIFRS